MDSWSLLVAQLLLLRVLKQEEAPVMGGVCGRDEGRGDADAADSRVCADAVRESSQANLSKKVSCVPAKEVVMCSGQARNPKPEGPTGFLANPKKPEPDIPGPRPEIFMYKMVKRYLSSY